MQASTVLRESLPPGSVRRPRALAMLAVVVVVAHLGLLAGLPFAPRDETLRRGLAASAVPPRAAVLSVVAPRTTARAAPLERAPAAPPAPPRTTRVARQAAAAMPAAAEPAASRAASAATDTRAASAPSDPPWPTRMPASAELHFDLRRGAASGEARLSWRVDGERYALALRGVLPAGREIDQHSQGGFDAAGVAPQRLAERRRGREVRAANFQREHGKISFSGPGWELPLQAGAQDRLSWLVQLVAIAGAAPGGLAAGRLVSLPVVGARGALHEWRFEVRGAQRLAGSHGAIDALWLVREPVHPYDVRVEVWLDPSRGHWPAQLRQTQVPGGEPLEWTLREHPTPDESADVEPRHRP